MCRAVVNIPSFIVDIEGPDSDERVFVIDDVVRVDAARHSARSSDLQTRNLQAILDAVL